MNIKIYTYVAILAALFSGAHTLHGMKALYRTTGLKLVQLLGKKKISFDIKKEIINLSDYSPGKTKINFSVNNNDVGFAIYDNSLYTDREMIKKYIYLNTIFTHKEKRKLGYGSHIVNLTRNIIFNDYYPKANIIKFDIFPFDAQFNSPEERALALKNLHEFYRKLGAITDEKTNTGYFPLVPSL